MGRWDKVRKEFCVSGKKGYPSRELAMQKVEGLRAKGRQERGCYRCPDCEMWHVTKSTRDNVLLFGGERKEGEA